MDEPRFMLLLFLLFFVKAAVSDCCLSSSPSFSLQLDVLDHDDPLDDETVVAEKLVESTNPSELQKFSSDVENQQWFSQPFEDVEDEKQEESTEFGDVDTKMLAEIENGGRDKSAKQTNWARSKFDGWRKFRKMDVSVPIEDIPLLKLNDMLVEFLLQIRKKRTGEMFPAASLNCLLKAIGRIVRKKQEARINSTGEREPRFNILRDDLFSKARLAFVAAAERSRKSGIGIKKKKVDCISYNSERDLLSDIDFQINTPKGLQKRLCYYMCTRFAVRGAQELVDVMDVDLSIESDGSSEFLLYNERVSKNWGTTVNRFDDDHFRPSIWSYEDDFILTYKQYIRHLPAKENSSPRALFLQPITNYKGPVWFQKGRVGVNNISKWIKAMGSILDIDICNKSGRVSVVTRMSMSQVPSDIGKLITGHRSVEAYQKYDRSKKMQINAAMSIVSKPFNEDGTPRLYNDVLTEMAAKESHKMLGLRSSKCLIEGGIASSSADILDNIAMDTIIPAVNPADPPVNPADPPVNLANPPVNRAIPSVNPSVPVSSVRELSSAIVPAVGSASIDACIPAQSSSAIIEKRDEVVKPNEKTLSAYFNEDDLIDSNTFDKFLKANPSLEKYFPVVKIQTFSGQFSGSIFNNCTIQLQVLPNDPVGVAKRDDNVAVSNQVHSTGR